MMQDHDTTIDTPHPDFENGVQRGPIDYTVNFPDNGINADTGIAFFIDGFGHDPALDYSILVRRYIASRYNCLCIGVAYFGCRLLTRFDIEPGPDFFANVQRHHGLVLVPRSDAPAGAVLAEALGGIRKSGITRLHDDCIGQISFRNEYMSFGVLPALDHFQVLDRILKTYPVNKKRIFAFGTSYGGYLAMLLGKLAPNTFSAIIDNSGFVASNQQVYANLPLRAVQYGVDIATRRKLDIWSTSRWSKHFFWDHHALIRTLLEPRHINESPTRYYLYHSRDDEMVPAAKKREFAALAKGRLKVDLQVVTPADLDGIMFKTMGHAMEASLPHLFDHAYGKVLRDQPEGGTGTTDFDLKSTYRFPCGKRSYSIAFGGPSGVTMSLGPA